jgi:hypothetical protein
MHIQTDIGGIVPCCGPIGNALQGAYCFDAGLFWDKLFRSDKKARHMAGFFTGTAAADSQRID